MSEFKKPTAFVDVPCEWVSATSQAEGVPVNFVIEHYDDEQLAEANEVLALIVARFSRENAKLRELVSQMYSDMQGVLDMSTDTVWVDSIGTLRDRMDYHMQDMAELGMPPADYEKRMRELGIEADR